MEGIVQERGSWEMSMRSEERKRGCEMDVMRRRVNEVEVDKRSRMW